MNAIGIMWIWSWIWIWSFVIRAEIRAEARAPNDANSNAKAKKRPNIILFLTDDQDVTAGSIAPSIMPHLHEQFRNGGMEFHRYYVSTGLCCPSRATILRGQYCHNTQVYDNGDLNNETYQSGGWSKFLGLETETIATMLQSVGYETALIGKYLNGYDLSEKSDAKVHKPLGWDHWMGLLTCFKFYGPIFTNGTDLIRTSNTVYQTDYMIDWVVDFLTQKRNTNNDKPLFLVVAPFAPHSPATPAKRHEHLFPNATVPSNDNDAIDPPDNLQREYPVWIKDMPKLTLSQIDHMNIFYKNRLRSLQAVDEGLDKLVQTLDDLDLTESTYFFYTSDNGQHFGDHRIPAGKRQAYETDVLVPFLVRGPGIPKGRNSKQIIQSVDLAPTFLDMAKATDIIADDTVNDGSLQAKAAKTKIPSYPFDGKSMLPLLVENSNKPTEHQANKDYNDFRWAALLELYSGSSNIGIRYNYMKQYYKNHMYPNTYRAVRVVNGPQNSTFEGADLLYVEWCTGELELYNCTSDPHQAHNLLAVTTTDKSIPPTREPELKKLLPLLSNLNKLVVRLANCKGSRCYDLKYGYGKRYGRAAGPTRDNNQTSRDLQPTRHIVRSLRYLELLGLTIQQEFPCHNPPEVSSSVQQQGNSTKHRRRPFAYNLIVPELFRDGFPFSDGEIVNETLLQTWESYQHYFY